MIFTFNTCNKQQKLQILSNNLFVFFSSNQSSRSFKLFKPKSSSAVFNNMFDYGLSTPLYMSADP